MRSLFSLGLTILCTSLLVGVLTGCESDLARKISAYESTRDYEAAKSLLQRTVQSDPENAEAQFLLGRLHLQEGSYQKGRQALEASREASPKYVERIDFLIEKNARERFLEGKEAMEAESFGQAVRHFQHMTQVQPSNALGHRMLGHALIQNGQKRDAESAYRKALNLEPENLETLNNLASLAFQRGAYQTSIEYALRALDGEVKEPQVIERLAYAYAQTGQPEKAEARFSQALERNPSAELRYDYALFLFNQERYQKALPLLQQLARGDNPEVVLVKALAETHYALANYQSALETYLRLHDRLPNDRGVLQNVVISYEKLEQYDKADAYRARLSGGRDAANE